MLSNLEMQYLKLYLRRTIAVLLVLFFLVYLTYSCDWDFAVRERYLSDDTTFYPKGITTTAVQKQKEIYYHKELRLEVVAQIQITGNFVAVGSNILRTNCPLQMENVDLYNKNFKAMVISVDNSYHQFSIMTERRLIKQLMSKLENNESFHKEKYGHKITMFGYLLKLPKYSDTKFQNVIITKIVFDNKVYE